MTYKKSGKTRNKILDASSRLFTEKGYYRTSFGDIAKAVGIGRASIYYYFPNKECVARALFDTIVEELRDAAFKVAAEDDKILLRTLVEYILLFKHIALNKATQAVYYDLVHYADYDSANIERVKNTFYSQGSKLAEAYGSHLNDKQHLAFIITSEAFGKALFKGILNGTLEFSLEEAMDYFCRHNLLCDIPIPEEEYQSTLKLAFRLCEEIVID